MGELNPAEKYRVETLKARLEDTKRDVAYHETQKIKHEAAATTGSLNLADIQDELARLEGKKND